MGIGDTGVKEVRRVGSALNLNALLCPSLDLGTESTTQITTARVHKIKQVDVSNTFVTVVVAISSKKFV